VAEGVAGGGAAAGAVRARVDLVVWGYPFDKSPSLQNLVRDLARVHDLRVFVDPRHARGLPGDVAIFVEALGADSAARSVPGGAASPPTASAEPAHPAAGVAYERGRLETWVRTRLPQRLRALAREVYVAREVLRGLPAFVRALRRAARPAVVVVADKTSLLAARLAGLRPAIYYSLEATPYAEETSLLYKALNRLERRWITRHGTWVVAQSTARAGLLQPDAARQVIVPVTSDGEPLAASGWLRERLGLAPGQVVLLAAGGLGADQMTQEIVEASRHWDPRFVLVLHSASGRFVPELLELVKAPELAARVRLSTDHFTIDEAERRVYAGADIGIVYYRDLGFNHRHTAYSSGKLAAFLRAGVPVIVPDFDEFRAAVAAHGFGVCARVEEIGAAAARLLDAAPAYRQAARAAFDRVYRHAPYRDRVAEVVGRLATGQGR